MARPRLLGSKLPLILARNDWRCSYRFTGCRIDKGLTLTWAVPPSLGGDASDAANYRTACRSCARRLPTLIQTGQMAA